MQYALVDLIELKTLIEEVTLLREDVAKLKANSEPGRNGILSLKQVQELLKDEQGRKPSTGTLKRWHINGQLIQRGFGRKIYYYASDVYNLKID